MKKLILIIVFLCLYISQSNKIYTNNKEVKIKNDNHLSISIINNQSEILNIPFAQILESRILWDYDYHFFLNSFISPIVGMKAETIKLLTPNKIVNKVCLFQIGELQSDKQKFINIYLIQSTGKLGRT